MEGEAFLGILFAIVASTNLNVGKAIQKWKVKVFGHGRKMFERPHRGDLGVWIVGFLLTFSATVLFSLALKYTDKSSMVSSLNGVGMIGLVIFAWLVLKEKIGRRELSGAAFVLVGTFVMGFFESESATQETSYAAFGISAGVLLSIAFPLALWSWRTKRGHGVTFGALAGTLLGVSVIVGDIALVSANNSFFGQLLTPWPYLALGIGTIAIVVTQLAFWRSTAMLVVPTINSFMILVPVVLEYFTFGAVLQPLSYVGIAVIVAGVVLLTGGQSLPAEPGAKPETAAAE